MRLFHRRPKRWCGYCGGYVRHEQSRCPNINVARIFVHEPHYLPHDYDPGPLGD